MGKREIKFRAWDNINKKWLLGYEYKNLGGFSMKGECMLFGEYTKALDQFALDKLDEMILMQFTGLLDKKGREIYEGDVIKTSTGKIDSVTFQNGSFYWNDEPICFESVTEEVFLPETWAEIIGNIYEHPSLLSVENDGKII